MEVYPVRFLDPIHGFIHLSPGELKLVESRGFRRLRHIKQLALTYLVYPGAMHTRFEHSLGVMELASRAFEAIKEKSGELLEENLKKIGMKLADAKSLLRATALLHDVGHLPFSHGGEAVLPKSEKTGEVTKHEQVSIAVIRDKVSALLERELYSGVVDHITRLLGEGQPPPELLRHSPRSWAAPRFAHLLTTRRLSAGRRSVVSGGDVDGSRRENIVATRLRLVSCCLIALSN